MLFWGLFWVLGRRIEVRKALISLNRVFFLLLGPPFFLFFVFFSFFYVFARARVLLFFYLTIDFAILCRSQGYLHQPYGLGKYPVSEAGLHRYLVATLLSYAPCLICFPNTTSIGAPKGPPTYDY